MIRRVYQITLVYAVEVHEDRLFEHATFTPEAAEAAQQMLTATLNDQDLTNHLMLREIAADLIDWGGYEGFYTLLTNRPADDYSPLKPVLATLSPESPEEAIGDEDAYQASMILEPVKK